MKTKQSSESTSQPIDYQAEYFRVWANVGNMILVLMPMAVAAMIGKRLAHFASGAYLPEGTFCDTNMIASLLNVEPDAVRKMAARNHVPRTKPGDALMFRASEFATIHGPTDSHPPSQTPKGPQQHASD